MTEALDTAGIRNIKEYIQRRQTTVVAQVAWLLIYEICTGEEHMTGTSKFMRWWDQDVGS